MVLNCRSSLCRCPCSMRLRHATTKRLWTSRPLHRGYTTSIALPPENSSDTYSERSPRGRLSKVRVSSTCFQQWSDNERFFQTPQDSFFFKLSGRSSGIVFVLGILHSPV